ncbi:TRAP transporter small permease subunit [Arcobacter peruensis]|uniref:TRAP transporter small permease subunit n=1 Tax=Arcobacter peruensis TaxID=2320140 RepID=UPI000F093AE4|nr:TRAP transporter small permease [Arcobacter peruensis]
MSLDSKIKTDQSTLSKVDQFFLKIESFMSFLGGVVIFLIVMISTVNILGRWLFSMPVNGYIDWIEQFMAFFAFLGIAYTQREGGHIRMDMLVSKLKGRFFYVTELFTTTIILFLTLVLIYGSSLHFLRAYNLGDTSLDIDLPTWPAKLVVPVALTFLALRLIIQIWAYIRAIKNNDTDAVAVPRVENAAEAVESDNKSYGVK